MLLVSCATTKLSYNFADWWIGWQIRDYVSLQSEQKQQVTRQVDELHHWHRTTQLVVYADFLQFSNARLVSAEIAIDDIVELSAELQLLMEPLKNQLIKPLAQLLFSLSDQQVEQLLVNLAKNSEEYAEKYLEPDRERRVKNRVKVMRKLMKTWLGRVSKEQKLLIGNWSQFIHTTAAFALENQSYWQERLRLLLLSRNTDEEAVQRYLHRYLFANERMSVGYRQLAIANQTYTYQLIVDVLLLATDKQRGHLSREIDRLAQELMELAAT